MDSLDKKCAKRIIRHFQKENAKLKAQLSNTRLGLEKIDSIIESGGQVCMTCVGDIMGVSVRDEHCHLIAQATTLADLITKVALKEED